MQTTAKIHDRDPLLAVRAYAESSGTSGNNAIRFIWPQIMGFVACGSLTAFSAVTTAQEYFLNTDDLVSSGLRTLGVQLGVIVFGALAILLFLMINRVKGSTRVGCFVGAVFAMAMGILQLFDSASTSFAYQSYALGQKSGDERMLAANLAQHETDSDLTGSRFDERLASLRDERLSLNTEKSSLDRILAPAVASGTTLKKSYSERAKTLTQQIEANRILMDSISQERMLAFIDLDSKRSSNAAAFAASNTSGAGNVARLIGLSPSIVLLARTAACELALLALAFMTGAALFYASVGSVRDRRRHVLHMVIQGVGLIAVFAVAGAVFVHRANAETEPEPDIRLPVAPVVERDDFNPLFGAPDNRFDDDGLPQASVGDVKDPLVFRFEHQPTLIGLPSSNRQPAAGCPIPKNVFAAIDAENRSARVKAIFAGAAFVESKWDPNETHYDSDGGNSHGLFQLHGKWRKKDVAWMKKQPGGWRDPAVNLAAFLRCIKEHQTYYPKSKGSWRTALAHYNGGGRPNWKYADRVLAKAGEVQRWFEKGAFL